MNIILFDVSEALCREWAHVFFGNDKVKIENIDLDTLIAEREFDGLVSPANSFGIMDGGIDKPIRDAFPEVQKNVTKIVSETFDGYIPVGSATVAETGDPRHPLLVVAPTMPYPKTIDPFIVYDVTRTLLAIADDAAISTLAIPGLGTATGRVTPKAAAHLMQVAWKHQEQGTSCSNWNEANAIINEVINVPR